MIMAIGYRRISPISLASRPDLVDGGTRTNCKGLAEEGHAKANEGTDHDVGGQAGTLWSVG